MPVFAGCRVEMVIRGAVGIQGKGGILFVNRLEFESAGKRGDNEFREILPGIFPDKPAGILLVETAGIYPCALVIGARCLEDVVQEKFERKLL